jgi:hypothetical protein
MLVLQFHFDVPTPRFPFVGPIYWASGPDVCTHCRRFRHGLRNRGGVDVSLAVIDGCKAFPRRSWHCSRIASPVIREER